MQSKLYCKILAIGIICLFIGVGIHPVFAVERISSTAIYKDEDVKISDEKEIRNYLFQTIKDIVNNPEVKELLDDYNFQIKFTDYKHKDVFRKIIFRYPNLLSTILLVKHHITYDFLETVYEIGLKCRRIFDEEEISEIMNSVKITNHLGCCELSNTIKDNILLNFQIEQQDTPYFCTLIGMWMVGFGFLLVTINVIADIFEFLPTISNIFNALGNQVMFILDRVLCVLYEDVFNCGDAEICDLVPYN